MAEKTERFEMRLSQTAVEQIDLWRKKQDDNPSRAEAIRRLIEGSLSKSPAIDDGQKLILMMLCGLYKHLKISDEIDPEFIENVIYGGHYWALKSEYSALFHNYSDTDKDVSEVRDILDMWLFIETSYNKLNSEDKNLLTKKLSLGTGALKFPGFDGNNEIEHLGIARFLIEKMGRFGHFKNRVHDLDSHSQKLQGYKRMLRIFLGIRPTLIGIDLSVSQLINIINADSTR